MTALQHVVDIDRHGGERAPDEPVKKPKLGSVFEPDNEVVKGMELSF
jgi:hypothetical protein